LEVAFKKMMVELDFMAIVLYPTLNNRRSFIHDCWIIAKGKENEELKFAVIQDPFFYLTREDLLALLKTHDNSMITKILNINCKMLIKEDIGYQLIKIKGT
jgi:hypothetical protein